MGSNSLSQNLKIAPSYNNHHYHINQHRCWLWHARNATRLMVTDVQRRRTYAFDHGNGTQQQQNKTWKRLRQSANSHGKKRPTLPWGESNSTIFLPSPTSTIIIVIILSPRISTTIITYILPPARSPRVYDLPGCRILRLIVGITMERSFLSDRSSPPYIKTHQNIFSC